MNTPTTVDAQAKAATGGRTFAEVLSDLSRVADEAATVFRATYGAPCPAAPDAATPTPEPRRTVGAVVRDGAIADYTDDNLLIVVADDSGACQRYLKSRRNVRGLADAYETDVFVRWATREECERHGIPFVDRTPPAAPVPPAAKPWTWKANPEVGEVWVHPMSPETHVIITDGDGGLTLSAGKNFNKGDRTGVGAASSDGAFGWYYLRPATASELAAAGLPPAEAPVSDGDACVAWLKGEGWSVSSDAIAAWNEATRRARAAAPTAPRSVDREGLVRAISAAMLAWRENQSDKRTGDEVAADAAVAFLGGAK